MKKRQVNIEINMGMKKRLVKFIVLYIQFSDARRATINYARFWILQILLVNF